jgi:hypothetical protein
MINIEKGKWYLQFDTQGYIIDCIRYNPQLEGYSLYESPSVPSDILNNCYKLNKNKLVLDEDKLKVVKEQEELRRKELEEQQLTLQKSAEEDAIEVEEVEE